MWIWDLLQSLLWKLGKGMGLSRGSAMDWLLGLTCTEDNVYVHLVLYGKSMSSLTPLHNVFPCKLAGPSPMVCHEWCPARRRLDISMAVESCMDSGSWHYPLSSMLTILLCSMPYKKVGSHKEPHYCPFALYWKVLLTLYSKIQGGRTPFLTSEKQINHEIYGINPGLCKTPSSWVALH